MTGKVKKSVAKRFRILLEQSAELTRKRVAGGGLEVGQEVLARFQCNRLAATYDDLRVQKRYTKAMDFFLTDLYGPLDFSQRDDDIKRVYPIMVNVLSADAIESLAQGLELNSLSMQLDAKLLHVLVGELGFDPQHEPDALDFQMYADGYRLCDNYAERARQIELIVELGENLEAVTRKRLILTAVKVARKPAQVAGFGELQSFIERGLAAFKAMGSANEFLSTMHSRETRLLDSIFENKPIPKSIRVK
ncbi:MAG: hypothetical protein AAF465_12000 [Pseudomonadota bacterium]